MKKTPEEIKKMARAYENYHPEDSDLVGAEKGGLFHGFIKGYTQCQQDNEKKVENPIEYSKVRKLLEALSDIYKWDDDLADEWEDAGYRAKSALAEYYKEN